MKKYISILIFFFSSFLLNAQEYRYNPDLILSFELNNGKEVNLIRTNTYFLQYQITNKEGEVEFTFPTDDKNSKTNYFVYHEENNAYNLTFKNEDALYKIYQKTTTGEIGILVEFDNKTVDLKGQVESLSESLQIFEATYPTVPENQFVNIKYQSSFILPSVQEMISDIKSGSKQLLLNNIEEKAIYSLSDESIRLHTLPKAEHSGKLDMFIQNSTLAFESKNIESIFPFFNSKYLTWLLYHHSYNVELDSSIKDRFSTFLNTGEYVALNYKEFEAVDFVKIYQHEGDNDLVFVKYKVTLNNGSVYNFDFILSIDLLPNGDFKYCLESGWG